MTGYYHDFKLQTLSDEDSPDVIRPMFPAGPVNKPENHGDGGPVMNPEEDPAAKERESKEGQEDEEANSEAPESRAVKKPDAHEE